MLKMMADKSYCSDPGIFHIGTMGQTPDILDFDIRQGEALHRQITRHVRSLIYTGSLSSGSKLPRMHDLARQWNTNYFTVHTALTGLVQEGLLERKPRLGTFVRKQNKELRSVGIYYGDEILVKHERAFYRSLHAQLLALLQKENISNRVFIDCRAHNRQQQPLLELAEAINSSTIQGLIVPLISPQVAGWLPNLSIPTSLFSSARTDFSRICVDNNTMMSMACQALREQGCRTVALINPIPAEHQGGGRNESDTIFNAFHNGLKAFDLKTRNSWVRVPKKYQFSQEKYGYQEFHKLWSQSEKPDGLIAFPENVSRGVVIALLEQQVKVPTDLKLVLHKNQNVEFLCPIPADWVITPEQSIAKALIQQVKDRFSGLEPRYYDIQHIFVKADHS
jgi:DNA-binding LacI/PurR family transcriptional regulator